MTFHSILFDKDNIQKEAAEQPEFFTDLNLDQVIDAITARKKEYGLKPFFYNHLRDAETIYYRHEVMRDLENNELMTHVKAFAEKMVIVRRYLGLVEKLDFHHHKEGWFLEAVLVYCEAVDHLLHDLTEAKLQSRGFQAFREYVANYVHCHAFQALQKEAQRVKHGLSNVKYCVIIQEGRFSVRKYDDETDYSVDVEQTFKKFKQGAVKNYLVELYEGSGMNHIEAKILEFVALLYPKPFVALDQFCANHSQFMDETIRVFDREIQFYVAYLDFIAAIEKKYGEKANIAKSAFLWGSVMPDISLGLLSLGYFFYNRYIANQPTSGMMNSAFDNLYFNNLWWIASHNFLHSPTALIIYAIVLWRYLNQPDTRGHRWLWFVFGCMVHSTIDIHTHYNDGPMLFFPFDFILFRRWSEAGKHKKIVSKK